MGIRVCISVLLLTFWQATGLEAFSSGARSQAPARNDLQHDVTVTIKLIQVYVLDKNDSPVTDLKRDDFVVYDNGRRQVITEFERHLLPGDLQVKEILDQTQPSSARTIPPQLCRKFFLVFHLDRITLDGFRQAKEAALYFLDSQVRPGDQVSLVTYSVLRGMTLYDYLTDDLLKVRDKLEKFREVLGRPGGGPSLWVMRAQALSEFQSQTGFTLTGLTREIYGEAARQRNPEVDWHEMKNLEFVQQMEEMAKSLRTVPGYKHVILFSNGFPRFLYEGNTFFQKNYDRMAQEFATANSPVHTVNTEGIRQYSGSIGSRGDSSLKNLSRVSGGRHFQNVKQHESIARELQAMTGNYYVLGYYSDEVKDGQYHKIHVEVTRPGCRVTAQNGYFNPKPYPEFTRFEKLLHLYDLAMNDTPQFQQAPRSIPLAALDCAETKDNLILLAQVDRSGLSTILEGQAELCTLIFDNNHHLHHSSRAILDHKDLRAEHDFHYTIASLPPGHFSCRVVIRNLETGEGAVGRAEAVLAEPLKSGIRLFTPLLFRPGGNAAYYKTIPTDAKRPSKSLNTYYPCLGKDSILLFDSLSEPEVPVLAAVRCQITGITEPNTSLSLELSDADGRKTAIPFEVIEVTADGECDSLLLEIRLPEVPAGKYRLEITAFEKSTGVKTRVLRPFRVH